MKFKGRFKIKHYGKDGKLKDKFTIKNAIVNIGKIQILDVMFHGVAASDPWYIGLIDGASTPTLAATDAMLLHPGWTEFDDYSEADRQEWDEDEAAVDGSNIVMPSANEATFSIDNDGSEIAGLFIVDDDAKLGTAGILWSTALFGSVKNLDNGDTLKVTYEITVG